MRKVGVLELDSYYPADDRMKLAMKLNGLLASPAFASWLVGERIDIASMLRTPDGRPRCAVVSIAHLDDEQRQSVVSVVLAKLISWMRRQSGTSDLRTLLYMDEVAGYLPPNGNPPTKPPIMLLLKQARAFGVGRRALHAEPRGRGLQGPVQRRHLDDRPAADRAGQGAPRRRPDQRRRLGGPRRRRGHDLRAGQARVRDEAGQQGHRLGVHHALGDELPARPADPRADHVAEGRRGTGGASRPGCPDAGPPPPAAAPAARGRPGRARRAASPRPRHRRRPGAPAARRPHRRARRAAPAPASPLAADETPVQPKVAAGIPVHYLDPAATWAASVGAVPGHRLTPGAIARVLLRFDDAKAGIVLDQEYEAVLTPLSPFPTADQFRAVDYDDRDLLPTPPPGAVYRLPPTEVGAKTWWTTLQRDLADTPPALHDRGGPDQPRAEALRPDRGDAPRTSPHAARPLPPTRRTRRSPPCSRSTRPSSRRPSARSTPRHNTLERQREARTSAIGSDAMGMLGGLFGGRKTSMTTAARRASAASDKVGAAEDKVEELQAVYADLQAELDAEMAGIRAEWAGQGRGRRARCPSRWRSPT